MSVSTASGLVSPSTSLCNYVFLTYFYVFMKTPSEIHVFE